MKKVFNLFIGTFIYSLSFSQLAAVSADRMNILYVGVDNLLTVAAENVSQKSLVVRASKGTLTREFDNHYVYIPRETGMIDILLYKKEKGKERLIRKVPFRVQLLPEPTAFVGNKKGGVITKQALIAPGGLIARLENSDFEATFRIDKFTVCILYQTDCDTKTIDNVGYRFNKDILAAFENLKKDDRVIIKNIYSTWPSGHSAELNPILFNIGD